MELGPVRLRVRLPVPCAHTCIRIVHFAIKVKILNTGLPALGLLLRCILRLFHEHVSTNTCVSMGQHVRLGLCSGSRLLFPRPGTCFASPFLSIFLRHVVAWVVRGCEWLAWREGISGLRGARVSVRWATLARCSCPGAH